MAIPLLYPVRLVVLDYPFKHWESKEVQEMFAKVVLMKRQGYWNIHQNQGMLPVDQTDLIGTNYIICYDTPEGLIPFTSYRTVSLERCEHHRVTFPPISVLQSSKQDTRLLEAILARAKKERRDIGYHSSFTKNDLMPKDTVFGIRMRSIITATAVGNCETVHEFIGCGALKFKMHEYFVYMGAAPITDTFSQHSVFGIEAIMYHHAGLTGFSPLALKDYEKNMGYWENRVQIGEIRETLVSKTKRVA